MPSSRPATVGLGVGLYLAGVFLFALNDALGKWLVADYGVGQLMMLRSIGAAFVLGPMVLSLRPPLYAVAQAPLHALRVVCMAADTFSFYWATRTMPLADVMTFYMASPLIVTALSAPLLGEKVERFRWIAVAMGFVGVLIALRPSPQMFSWGSPLALFGASMFALGQTLTRKLRRAHWLQLTVWQFAGGGARRRRDDTLRLDDPRRVRPRPDGLGRHRLDVLLRPHHPRSGARARRRARPAAIIRHPVGCADGLCRLARRADPADHRRQRGDHRRRALSCGARADGGQRGGVTARRHSSPAENEQPEA